MNSTLATWEDDDNNRQIQFSVVYTTENGAVEIDSITPEKISFVCSETNTCNGSIGIWTETGRELVAQKIQASSAIEQLKTEIVRQSASSVKSAPHIKISANCAVANA